MTPSFAVDHDEAAQSYQLRRDGEVVSHTDYLRPRGGDVLVFHHTLTRPDMRGHGYAARIVQAAMDDVRARGLTVAATCWFVVHFLDEHPEYSDLRAG